MGLLDNESIPRRKMILFFMIDTSGSMYGSKIGSVMMPLKMYCQ